MAVKLIPGRNDLATVNPALAAQWDYESNGDLNPTIVSAGSSKKSAGFANKVIIGRQLLQAETPEPDALIAPEKRGQEN